MKSKSLAYVLWFVGLFGWFGLHRFYLDKSGTGIAWIFTVGLFGIGSAYDLITLANQVDIHNLQLQLNALSQNYSTVSYAISPQLLNPDLTPSQLTESPNKLIPSEIQIEHELIEEGNLHMIEKLQ